MVHQRHVEHVSQLWQSCEKVWKAKQRTQTPDVQAQNQEINHKKALKLQGENGGWIKSTKNHYAPDER